MSPATVARLADYVARRDVTRDDKIAAIAQHVDGLGVRATDQAVRLTVIAEVQTDHGERLERIEAGVLEALEIGKGAAQRAERASALSDEDVTRIASEVGQRLERPIVQARSLGMLKGAGLAIGGALVGLIGAFADDPIAFAEAFERIFR